MSKDDEVKQAIGAVARLGGFTIKRVATTDDLKDRTLTITLTRVSDGWVQQRLDFEDEAPKLVASVNGRGEVESLQKQAGPLDIIDPSDLTEKDETLAQTDPDEGLPVTDRKDYDSVKVGAATGEPREGIEAEQGQVVELNTKKRR